MEKISIIGLDLAKRVFQVHGINNQGETLVQKQLQRCEMIAWFSKLDPCLIGIEACATSHYWARELTKLGHDVKLIPPAYVKPYVRRQKNDRADAAAICEAVSRPSMRFASTKTKERLGSISKQGNPYLRKLLVQGAMIHLRGKRYEKAVGGTWFHALLHRKTGKVAAVALANKMARVAWAVLTKEQDYQQRGVAPTAIAA